VLLGVLVERLEQAHRRSGHLRMAHHQELSTAMTMLPAMGSARDDPPEAGSQAKIQSPGNNYLQSETSPDRAFSTKLSSLRSATRRLRN